MEDWAYAASWDKSLAVKGGCVVRGYDRARTAAYDDASNRCSMILVETSNAKAGPPELFGSPEHVFDPGHASSGHAARNGIGRRESRRRRGAVALIPRRRGGGAVP